ncbi:MAG: TonB-dependent receptor plug domain-containing protein [candidate division WOR-3 bacterium]
MFWIDTVMAISPFHMYAVSVSSADPIYSLNSLPSVYLIERGPFGIQADISLRGLSFNQTRILYNGIPLYDPQTGHHNSNLPFTEMDISGFGLVSSFYSGFANLPGINITPSNISGGILRIGGRGYVKGIGKFYHQNNTLSFEGFRWDGYVFEYDNGKYFNPANSIALFLSRKETDFDVFAGYRYNSFSAKGFYLPPTFESNETTQVALLGGSFKGLKLFARWHQDQFNWGTGRNLHNTLNSGGEFSHKIGFLEIKTGGNAEYIKSSIVERATGIRDTMRYYAFILPSLISNGYNWVVKGGLKVSYDNFSGKLGYEPYIFGVYGWFSLNAYYSRRLPDFTELFYSDPKNYGNKNLKPERVLGFDFGVDADFGIFKVYAIRFYDRIDWVKRDDKYFAENIQTHNIYGFEAFSPVYYLGPITLNLSFSALYPDVKGAGRYTPSFPRYRFSFLTNILGLRVENDTTQYDYFGYKANVGVFLDLNLNMVGFKGDYTSQFNCGIRNLLGVRPMITSYMQGLGRWYYCEYRHFFKPSTTL